MSSNKNVTAKFTDDIAPPIITINTPRPGLTSDKNPVLSFDVNEEGTSVVTVDGKVVNVVSGEKLGPLSDGTHVIRIQSTDVSGNSSYQEVVVIYNAYLSEEWRASVGLGNSDIVLDKTENVYVAGSIPNGASTSFKIAKYDSGGRFQWEKILETISGFEFITGMEIDKDGSIYVSGRVASSPNRIIKLTADGGVSWSNNYGGIGAKGIAIDMYGNITVTSYEGDVNRTIRTFKYSALGVEILNTSYSPISMSGHPMAADANGNYYVSGIVDSPTIIKFTETGAVDWISIDLGHPLAMTIGNNGNLYTVGYKTSPISGKTRIYPQIIDPSGQLLWSNFFNDSDPVSSYGTQIALDKENSIYVVGYSPPAIKNILIKYDNAGNIRWTASDNTLDYIAKQKVSEIGNIYLLSNNGEKLIKYNQFSITTPSELTLTDQVAYPLVLTAIGGFGSYQWSLSDGFLPSGLLLDPSSGLISGTPAAAGTYSFTAQVTDANGVTAQKSITILVPSYPLTTEAGIGGTVSPASITVGSGASQVFTITPNTGYHVASVTVDGVTQGAITSYTFTNVTAAHTISATFAINTYTVTASAGSNGGISPAGTVEVNYGDSQVFTITPNAGYRVASVVVDGVSQGSITRYTFTNVTAAHTISATFVKTYNITATAGTNGSISPTGTVVVNSGARQTYIVTPKTGHTISTVKVDGVSKGAITSYTFSNVTATHTISATFK